jgi:hypothetical protein
MTLHWLRLDATGASRLEPLPALAMHYQGPVDAEAYRRRARGEEPPVSNLADSILHCGNADSG